MNYEERIDAALQKINEARNEIFDAVRERESEQKTESTQDEQRLTVEASLKLINENKKMNSELEEYKSVVDEHEGKIRILKEKMGIKSDL